MFQVHSYSEMNCGRIDGNGRTLVEQRKDAGT